MAFNTLTGINVVTYSTLLGDYIDSSTGITGVTTKGQNLGEKVFYLDDAVTLNKGIYSHYWYNTKTQDEVSGYYPMEKVLGTNYAANVTVAAMLSSDSAAYVASPYSTGVMYVVDGRTISAFDATKAYVDDQYVVYGNTLYTANGNQAAAAWDDAHFNAVAFANGTKVELVDMYRAGTAFDGKVDMVRVTNYEVYKMGTTPVTTSTTGANTYVKFSASALSATNGTPTIISTVNALNTNKGVSSKLVSYPTDIAKNDIVLVSTVYNYADGKTYYNVEKAESFTGTLTAWNSNTNKVTINGQYYAISGVAGAAYGPTQGNDMYKACKAVADVTYFTDKGGFIVNNSVADPTANLTNYVYVAGSMYDGNLLTGMTVKASVVKTDGSTSAVTVAKVAAYGATPAAIDATGKTAGTDAKSDVPAGWYTYTTNAAGGYILTGTAATAATAGESADHNFQTTFTSTCTSATDYTNAHTTYTITKGAAKFVTLFTADGTKFDAGVAQAPVGTASTVFMVWNNTTKVFDTYTGIANVPNVGKGANVISVLSDKKGYALAVYVKGVDADASLASSDVVVLTSSTYDTVYVAATASEYYVYNALVNGETKTVAVDSNAYTVGAVYFAAKYTAIGDVKVANLTAVNSTASGAQVAGDVTALAYNGGTVTVSGTDYIVLGTGAKVYVINAVNEATTGVTVNTYEDGSAINSADVQNALEGTGDTIGYLYVSATNHAAQAVYLYVK